MRRILALTATAVTFLFAPALAQGHTGSKDNFVDASPTIDASAIHRVNFAVFTDRDDTVDSQNIAQANPHDCTGCEGIAAAFQAVIVTTTPSTVTPLNLAAAVNSNCQQCGAFAYAFQYIVQTDGRGRLSSDARDEIDDLEEDAEDAIDAGLPYDQLNARLGDLAARFKAVVKGDLARRGQDPHGGRSVERQDEEPAGD
jgi:putative peptide zinc metalloprotease protein